MPSPTIGVRIDKACAPSVSDSWVRRVIGHALCGARLRSGWIGVLVTNNAQIRRYNRRYLRHDYATDVIAFGASEDRWPRSQPRYIGDLVVSAQKARQVSKELGIRFDEELARYLVHGTLHLAGYRDTNTKERKRMHAFQEKLLNRLRMVKAA